MIYIIPFINIVVFDSTKILILKQFTTDTH